MVSISWLQGFIYQSQNSASRASCELLSPPFRVHSYPYQRHTPPHRVTLQSQNSASIVTSHNILHSDPESSYQSQNYLYLFRVQRYLSGSKYTFRHTTLTSPAFTAPLHSHSNCPSVTKPFSYDTSVCMCLSRVTEQPGSTGAPVQA